MKKFLSVLFTGKRNKKINKKEEQLFVCNNLKKEAVVTKISAEFNISKSNATSVFYALRGLKLVEIIEDDSDCNSSCSNSGFMGLIIIDEYYTINVNAYLLAAIMATLGIMTGEVITILSSAISFSKAFRKIDEKERTLLILIRELCKEKKIKRLSRSYLEQYIERNRPALFPTKQILQYTIESLLSKKLVKISSDEIWLS